MERPKFPNPKIYIFYSAGCHGHYLMYLIDRLSKNTAPLNQLPFDNLGNSHEKLDYSNYVKLVWPQDERKVSYNKSNIIKILYTDDVLYYERAAMNRAGNANRDLNNLHNDISFLQEYNKNFYEKIQQLYKVKKNSVPKWMLRDAYKLGFLDIENQGSMMEARDDINWMDKKLSANNVIHYTQVTAFYSTESLLKEMQKIDIKFDLNLDLTQLPEIHEKFLQGNEILKSNKKTSIVLDAVDQGLDVKIPALDIIQEAYVYAMLEKNNDFITMPMIDGFFETTGQLIDYIDNFPEHYKAMNPNLPKFNNIDNPFFLHRQKTK